MTTLRISVFALALSLAACGDGNSGGDAGTHDAGRMDAGAHDAGTPRDAGHAADAGHADAGSVDAGNPDAGNASDAGNATDAGHATDAGTAGDAGPLCSPTMPGRCEAGGVSCMCCPAGGPLNHCLCTDDDCTDAARPHCNQPSAGETGICTPLVFVCAWGAICASPDTPIDTPKGERAIAELAAGDLVYSMNGGSLAVVPIARVARTEVADHAVVRVELASGRALEISAGHPTADGRTFGDLAPGETLDGVAILSVQTIPYRHRYTHDILPASDSGTYVAGGVLIGSTLAER